MRNVIIIGAGGHAKVIADMVIKSGDRLLGFLDDKKTGTVFGDYKVLGTVADADNFKYGTYFIIGIGSAAIRQKLSGELSLNWYTAIHPSAQISAGAKIDCGTAVMANAVINADAKIGKHCIINTSSVVEHDCVLADFVHISPSATLCGTVTVGNATHIGAGAVVKNNISICDNVTVGCGAAVVKDITLCGTWAGVPAKPLK